MMIRRRRKVKVLMLINMMRRKLIRQNDDHEALRTQRQAQIRHPLHPDQPHHCSSSSSSSLRLIRLVTDATHNPARPHVSSSTAGTSHLNPNPLQRLCQLSFRVASGCQGWARMDCDRAS
eukprot:2232178-Rhodomonas_salina.1